MTVRLFSYGTLQLEKVQIEIFGRRLVGKPDVLPGYRREMLRIIDPSVIATSGSASHQLAVRSISGNDEIAGAVFEITEEELAAADSYEVADYERVTARLRSGLDAWVYVRA
jgi:hypothetical protein